MGEPAGLEVQAETCVPAPLTAATVEKVDPEEAASLETEAAEEPAEASPDEPEGDEPEGDEPEGDEPDEGDDPEPDAEPSPAERFAEMVVERERRLRYSHGLMRPVYTPEEEAILGIVNRRAALWVPTFTVLALAGSAVAALALATRIGQDPQQQSGMAFWVVVGAVVLLGASFLTLFRSELHFERMRPPGRLVRADIADAYDAVRDAPRAFVDLGAQPEVLTRVSDLLPTAERLVDALVLYHAAGGTLVRSHPAYERIIRMRAEVEVLLALLADLETPQVGVPTVGPRETPMPRPEQVADYDSLGDIVAFIGSAAD